MGPDRVMGIVEDHRPTGRLGIFLAATPGEYQRSAADKYKTYHQYRTFHSIPPKNIFYRETL
jgi:hypothetical protein